MPTTKITTNSLADSAVTSAKLASSISIDNLSVSNNLIVDTNTLVVDSANNRVGVGTTSPRTKIDIVGITTPNSHRFSQNTFIIDDTEGLMQFISTDSGSFAGGLVFTASPASGNNKHWGIHMGGPSVSNRFTIGYLATTGSGSVSGFLGAEKFTITTSGNVGIGTTSPSARLHTISTTEQMRIGYDDSNYFSATVDATGAVTLNAVGSGAIFNFSDNVSAANLVYNTGDQSIAGDKTFTDDVIVNGQITSPNQTDTTGDSVLTRRLADARYLSNIGLLSLASITLVDVAMGFSSGAVNTTLNQPALEGATELRLTTTVGMAVGMTIATNIFTGIPHNTYITAINAAAVSPLPNVTISAPLIADIPSGQTIHTVVVAGGTVVSSGRSMFAITNTTLGSESSLIFGGFNPASFVYSGEPSFGSTGINFSRKTYFGFKITTAHGSNSSPNAGADGWVRMGCSRQYRKYGAPEAPNKAVGIWRSAGSYYGWVMDGTTLNISPTPIFTTTSALAPVTLVEITGDGLGNFTFYINGVAMQTLSGGPTGFSGQEGTQFAICVRNLTGGAASNCTMAIVNGQFIFTYLE